MAALCRCTAAAAKKRSCLPDREDGGDIAAAESATRQTRARRCGRRAANGRGDASAADEHADRADAGKPGGGSFSRHVPGREGGPSRRPGGTGREGERDASPRTEPPDGRGDAEGLWARARGTAAQGRRRHGRARGGGRGYVVATHEPAGDCADACAAGTTAARRR